MEEFVLALVPITGFLTLGGVLVFRPLTKRLGLMLEANAASKRSDEIEKFQHEHMRVMLEAQNLKIEALEQRIEFSESLLEARAANLMVTRGAPRELT